MRTMISILRQTGIVWIFAVLTAMPVIAALEDDVARDFDPLNGYVVMEEAGEFIIDLDSGHGIKPGDIFAVAGTGKKIVHPVSNKILGELETVKGVLKVTRISSGYSFARALDGAEMIKRGDSIRRYALLPAVFWDYSGSGNPIYLKLQQRLPQLKWVEYHQAQRQRPAQPKATPVSENALTFVYTKDRLEIRDPEFNLLHQYPSAQAAVQPPTASKAPVAAAVPAPKPPKRAASVPMAPVITPEYKQVQTMATLSRGALITDFVTIDQNLLLASTDGTAIDIFKVSQSLDPVASGRPDVPSRILALKWWVPDATSQPYLAVTSWQDEAVQSMIFKVEGGRLISVADGISDILGTFDLNADGLPETLLSQDFDGENFYGERIKAVELTGRGIRTKSTSIKLPRRFTVLGSVIADLTGDGHMENAFVRNGILLIFRENHRLYKSVKKMGGSLSFLTYDVAPGVQDSMPATAAFEISPLVADLDGDGRKELIATSSDRSALGNLRVTPGLTKTWMTIFKFADGRFTTGTLGEELDLPLQGMAVGEGRILLVATEPGDFTDNTPRNSYLLAYGLAP